MPAGQATSCVHVFSACIGTPLLLHWAIAQPLPSRNIVEGLPHCLAVPLILGLVTNSSCFDPSAKKPARIVGASFLVGTPERVEPMTLTAHIETKYTP